MDGENTGMSAATETENPLERGRWAGEKSRVRESIVAPIDEWREENVKRREPRKRFLDRCRLIAGTWPVGGLIARNLENYRRVGSEGKPA